MLDILILQKIIQEKLKRINKKIPQRFDYSRIEFLEKEKDLHRIEKKKKKYLH